MVAPVCFNPDLASSETSMSESSFAIGTAEWEGLVRSLPELLSDERRSLLLVAVAVLIVSYIFYHFALPDPEAPIPYEIHVPAVYLESNFDSLEILESPSISIPGSTVIQCYAPANGKLLGRLNPYTPDGIDRAIEKAKEAQQKYSKTSFSVRRKVLKSLLKHIFDNTDHIVRAACLDSGKTRLDAAFGEILVTAEKIQWAINNGERVLQPESRAVRNLIMCYKKGEVRYEPLGVCAACVSWNYPFHNVLGPIITSIITGNALIIKPSERTAHSTQYFLAIVKGALQANGQPPDLVTATPCWPETANHLTSHRDVAHVLFIGSKPVAHHVAASTARALTPIVVELGGKDPAIILSNTPDSDLPRVASVLMRGVFQASGQNCIGIERIIAQPRIHDRLLALLEPRVKALRAGSVLDSLAKDGPSSEDVDVGACISDAGFDRLESLVKDAVAHGAKLHVGGSRLRHSKYPSGHYFAPTLLSEVTPDMRIAQEELFAPVMLFISPTYNTTVDQTIRTANSAPFGLGSAVFGLSGSSDVKAVVAGLRTGMVAVNDFASTYVCSLPFGGVGESGYGRFGGPEGLRGVCNAKSVCEDRFWGLVKTGIPPRMDFRSHAETISKGTVREEEGKRWAFVTGVIKLGFGLTISQQAGGLWNVLKNL